MKRVTYLITILLLFNMEIFETLVIGYPIIPEPQVVKSVNSTFQLSDVISISIIGKDFEKLSYSVSHIEEVLQAKFNVRADILRNQDDATIILKIVSKIDCEENIPTNIYDEAYRLLIDKNGILIEATTPHGIFYGTMSLVQLLEQSTDGLLGIEIIDWPDLKVRGISDDISRGQVSNLENFKRIIKFIARYKMNTYMPYIEDVLEFDCYPSIGKGRGALTKEEVKEIIKFADEHFVEVVPIFQTLGHYENILVMKEFLDYAEFPGAASLCVANENIYIFLENMLKEIFELFPSEYFHMGADESYDVGLGKSRHLVANSSLAQVHADHYKKVYSICRKYNKKVLMYGDIILNHPDILNELPKDVTIVDWHYRAEDYYPSTTLFKNAGFDYYVSSSVWNFITTFPTYINAIPNIINITDNGVNNGASGMINSNWGDYGAETFKELVLFGYALSAQAAWSYDKTEISNFSYNFFNDFFGIQDSSFSIIYQELSNPQNQMIWHEVWRHPLLELRPPVWWQGQSSFVVKTNWMDWTLPKVKEKIEELKGQVKRNSEHLEILEYILELNQWYKKKLKAHSLLQKILKKQSNNISEAENLIFQNIKSLKSLKKKFREIWLKYYKVNNLNYIEDKFDRLVSYFEESKDELVNNELNSPVLKSKWIYYTSEEDSIIRNSKFRYSFELNSSDVESAYLQLLGDTYAKLYINEQFVDEVYARRSLSLLVDYERIKFINIKKYLIDSTNTIEVIVQNFNRRGNAGVNIIAEIKTDNDKIEIITDEKWFVSKSNNDWIKASVREYPFTIINPNFNTKRPSWIER
ncbi:MAG: beta-N-acetylhexosaminidase [Ignavibacteriales bacterium]|nr:beta-N-acetylhexosaminidase [Ignavibacteriales bacterium]